jgi:Domain of unknown function (DUF1963)
MATFFKIGAECQENTAPKIGGGVFLPNSMAWPLDKSGLPLLHLLTLPSELVNQFVTLDLPSNHCISVFIPYKPGEVEHLIDLARKDGTAKVLLYESTTGLRQECKTPLLPAKVMEIYETDDDEEDEFSDEIDNKIGGHGIWLQNRIEIPGKVFLLQVLGATMNQNWPSHQGILMGGVGYLFVSNQFDSASTDIGEFILQYT